MNAKIAQAADPERPIEPPVELASISSPTGSEQPVGGYVRDRFRLKVSRHEVNCVSILPPRESKHARVVVTVGLKHERTDTLIG